MIAAIVFLLAYAWPILNPDLNGAWLLVCGIASWVTWSVFALDYAARIWFAPDRKRFAVRHLHDLAMVALPLLRPLRLLRLVTMLGVLHRRAGSSLRGQVIVYSVGGAALVIVLAALAVLDAERAHPGAGITTFGEALWWAVVSTTTVGYGDYFPITGIGRLIAVGLMVAGIALLGTVTAILASWLVEKVKVEQEVSRDQLAELANEVRLLRADLDRSRRDPAQSSIRCDGSTRRGAG